MANRFPLIFNSGAGQIQELAASDNLDLTSSNLVNAGILFTSSGSATAPSMSIGSGTTYPPGLYSPGTDQLAVATNGTGRLFVNANGRVGVMVTPSTTFFHVYTDAPGTVSAPTICLEGGFNGYGAGIDFASRTSSGGTLVSMAKITADGEAAWTTTASTQDANLRFFTAENGSLGERLRITSTGALNFVGAGTAGATQAVSFNGSAPVNSLVIDSSGRLGIGSSAPTGNLSFGATDAIINSDTSDASDNKSVSLAGGGTASTARGGYMQLYGNEYTTTGGVVDINSGNVANSYVRIQGRSSSSDIRFWINASEAGRFDSSGRLLVGTSTARTSGGHTGSFQLEGTTFATATAAITTNSNDSNGAYLNFGKARGGSVGSTTIVQSGDVCGQIQFNGSDGTSLQNAASITCLVDGTPGASDMPGRLVFSTNPGSPATSPTERMRIKSNGTIHMASGGNPPSSTVTGVEIHNSGYIYVVTSSTTVAYFNRNTSDGTLLEFRKDDAAVGTISVSGGTVSYNPFLGSHWGRLPDNQKTNILVGTILETVDQLIEWKVAVFNSEGESKIAAYNGAALVGETVEIQYEGKTYEAVVQYEEDPTSDLNKHVCVKVNDVPGSKAVFGVFLGWDNDPSKGIIGTWNDMYCAAVGNYFIRMAAGQKPEIGDLVEADGAGCGVIQDDDIIRTKTVAKITSTIPQATYDDGSFLVTCVLCCG